MAAFDGIGSAAEALAYMAPPRGHGIQRDRVTEYRDSSMRSFGRLLNYRCGARRKTSHTERERERNLTA